MGILSPKAADSILNSNAPINIWHGAVRSSKTINSIIAWLQFIGESPHYEFLMNGKTWETLHRNVLRTMFSMLDAGNQDYTYKQGSHIEIEDKIIWTIGFNDEKATDKVRGMTVGGWYSDETVTAPKSTVEMMINRCSLEDSRIFWTMNPDSPYHYIYTDFITDKTKLNSGDVKVWHFTLDDNPNLPSTYVERMKRMYAPDSVHYKRNILGLWVIAEGVIYSRFVESQNTFPHQPYPDYDYYVLSTDYGVSSVTVFGLFGIIRSPNGNQYHLLREWYYDAAISGREKTDSELINEAIKLLPPHQPIDAFYIPHDAASLRAEARTRHHHGHRLPVRTYTPNVLNDIREIQTLIYEERFKIHKSCENSIMQAQTYSWDPKAQERGEDKPLKQNDHCPDMWRGAILGTRHIGTGNLNQDGPKTPYKSELKLPY